MHADERRQAIFEEARAALRRHLDHDGVGSLEEHQRRTEVARYVRSLAERWPDLDGQLSRRLLADALAGEGAEAGEPEHDAPASGHANVTTLRRDPVEPTR